MLWTALRWIAWMTAVVVLVLAPFAWAPVELAFAVRKLLELEAPVLAKSILDNGGSVVLYLLTLWARIEPYWQRSLLATFAAIFVYARFAPLPRWLCTLMKAAGWGGLAYLLNVLSYQLWTIVEAAASEFAAIAPPVAGFIAQKAYDLEAAFGAAGMARLNVAFVAAVLLYGLFVTLLVRDGVSQVQEYLQSAFIGDVDPVFPRAPSRTAERCAQQRRKAIDAYLNHQSLPPTHYSQVVFSNGQTPFRFVREYVERWQEIQPVDPLRVIAFLEVPKGSPIKSNNVCLDTSEEVVGQYARLKFETARGPDRDGGERDNTLVLLLSRVVDAALLADQYLDAQRDDQSWHPMPFFERIYVEYAPIPAPFDCLLSPILGDGFPARVVIETQYEKVFRQALAGGKGKYGQFRNWFGIGVQIEAPNLPQDFFSRFWRAAGGTSQPVRAQRSLWFAANILCRLLKSRVAGGVSGKLTLELELSGSGSKTKSDVHIVSSGPLADGCRDAPRADWRVDAYVSGVPESVLYG